MLNVGGNIRIIGTKPDGSGWVTGVKDPANTEKFAVKPDARGYVLRHLRLV